jgi:hypothetical protein
MWCLCYSLRLIAYAWHILYIWMDSQNRVYVLYMCSICALIFRGEESIWCISMHILWWREYVLDMHYIFPQHSLILSYRRKNVIRLEGIGYTSNKGLSWQGLGEDVSLGKALVRMSAMLRLVGTWCILMSPFCKWSCSHLILRSTCLVLESPGLMLFVQIAIYLCNLRCGIRGEILA